MGVSLDRAILAVDGGGSRCRMVLEAGPQRFATEAGPTNVASDRDGAVAEILGALSRLSRTCGVAVDALAGIPTYLGLAGIVDASDREALRPFLPFSDARIEDDRPAALAGALGPTGAGTIAHCGTGSFLGRRADGKTRFAGGWGHRLGDEASATWVARRALAATLAASDETASATDLTRALSDRLGRARGIVDFAHNASAHELGALAPEVTRAADLGDPVARGILEDGAGYLARMLDALGRREEEPVCLTGGLGRCYAPYLLGTLTARLQNPLGEPIDGALALARSFVREREI
ncbi:MAG: BadF/BadG/BcrA/BcrD ATPase family protein [Pseudomonadota bacterium]